MCIRDSCGAALFMERDNDTYKNLRTIPVTSTEMVAAKYAVLLLLSILFCISSTAASILCGSICFDVTNIIYKLMFSVLDGIMIALSALPLVLLIVFFSKSYIFRLCCVFFTVYLICFPLLP